MPGKCVTYVEWLKNDESKVTPKTKLIEKKKNKNTDVSFDKRLENARIYFDLTLLLFWWARNTETEKERYRDRERDK